MSALTTRVRNIMRDELIEFALKNLGTTQKELALRLGVSPAIVSKWKSGSERIPYEREQELLAMLGLEPGNELNEITVLVGSEAIAKRWVDAFQLFVDYFEAQPCANYREWDSSCYLGISFLLRDILEIGIELPTPPVREELEDSWSDEESGEEKADEVFYLLQAIFESINYRAVWHDIFLGYYSTSVDRLTEIDSDYYDHSRNIYWSIWPLTLEDYSEKLIERGADPELLKAKINEGKDWIRQGLNEICKGLTVHALPFETDYFNLLDCDAFWLMEDADLFHDSLKEYSSEAHIDFYAREQLNSLRAQSESWVKLRKDMQETVIPTLNFLAESIREIKEELSQKQ